MGTTYSATVAGNRRGLYIDACRNRTFVNASKAINFAAVDFDGVNELHIYRFDDGNFYIAQAGGYTYDRGAFCDLYDEDGNKYTYDGKTHKIIKEA